MSGNMFGGKRARDGGEQKPITGADGADLNSSEEVDLTQLGDSNNLLTIAHSDRNSLLKGIEEERQISHGPRPIADRLYKGNIGEFIDNFSGAGYSIPKDFLDKFKQGTHDRALKQIKEGNIDAAISAVTGLLFSGSFPLKGFNSHIEGFIGSHEGLKEPALALAAVLVKNEEYHEALTILKLAKSDNPRRGSALMSDLKDRLSPETLTKFKDLLKNAACEKLDENDLDSAFKIVETLDAIRELPFKEPSLKGNVNKINKNGYLFTTTTSDGKTQIQLNSSEVQTEAAKTAIENNDFPMAKFSIMIAAAIISNTSNNPE